MDCGTQRRRWLERTAELREARVPRLAGEFVGELLGLPRLLVLHADIEAALMPGSPTVAHGEPRRLRRPSIRVARLQAASVRRQTFTKYVGAYTPWAFATGRPHPGHSGRMLMLRDYRLDPTGMPRTHMIVVGEAVHLRRISGIRRLL